MLDGLALLSEELSSDQRRAIDLILEHRQLEKLRGTYVDALPALVNPQTGRVHTSFSQTGAVTGRLSSSNPNLQNIPIRTEIGREIRRAIIAPPGWQLISADYSQVELRILADVADEELLIEAFLADQDIHAVTGARLFNVPLEEVTKSQRGSGQDDQLCHHLWRQRLWPQQPHRTDARTGAPVPGPVLPHLSAHPRVHRSDAERSARTRLRRDAAGTQALLPRAEEPKPALQPTPGRSNGRPSTPRSKARPPTS